MLQRRMSGFQIEMSKTGSCSTVPSQIRTSARQLGGGGMFLLFCTSQQLLTFEMFHHAVSLIGCTCLFFAFCLPSLCPGLIRHDQAMFEIHVIVTKNLCSYVRNSLCRWSNDEKKWFAPPGADLQAFRAWWPPKPADWKPRNVCKGSSGNVQILSDEGSSDSETEELLEEGDEWRLGWRKQELKCLTKEPVWR